MSRLWAVTCFFNPSGYRRKLPNYRVFRERLTAPLLAVELASDGAFELEAGDADILVRVRDGDVLWQKERLLNLGVAALPSDCEYVAWLDSDLVFERSDWDSAAMAALDRAGLCQLFGTLHHLRPEALSNRIVRDAARASHESVGSAAARGVKLSVARSTPAAPNPYRRGHAWCARRDLIARYGLYDASVVGGGDNMILFAATGQADEFIARGNISPAHACHYRAWASDFHRDAHGISHVEGDVLHLWHGELARRRYYARGEILTAADYDPEADIRLGSDGCWRWSSAKPEMHRRIREYFEQRDEDGRRPAAG